MTDITSAPSEAAFPTTEEGTVHDLRLAEALGFKRPANIRNLIKRHRAILEAIGPLLQREAMVGIGSGAKRAVTEFHLSKAQAAFIIGKSDTREAESVLALISESFAMLSEGKLVAADEAAQAELDAAAARAAERHRLMREDKDDFSRILKGFSKSPSRSVIGHKPDGAPILRELTTFENQREERLAAQKRQSRWAAQGRKTRNPGDPD